MTPARGGAPFCAFLFGLCAFLHLPLHLPQIWTSPLARGPARRGKAQKVQIAGSLFGPLPTLSHSEKKGRGGAQVYLHKKVSGILRLLRLPSPIQPPGQAKRSRTGKVQRKVQGRCRKVQNRPLPLLRKYEGEDRP